MSIFNFWKNDTEILAEAPNPTKNKSRRPIPVDRSESMLANKQLTKNLYHNTYPGMRLAGSLAFPIIALPVYFMGIPTPRHPDEKINNIFESLVEGFRTEMQSMHIQAHREGTIWIWPKFDRFTNKIVWEFISDDSVTDIIRDISSGRIISIWTDEQITIATKYNEQKVVRRLRNFTESMVTVTYTGAEGISDDIKDVTMRNPAGVMPIPFSNNSDGEEVRGHSDYERLIPDFKMYHDISLSEQEILSKFKPKMVFEVMNVDDWLGNNGYSTIDDINIASLDLIFNIAGKEKVYFVDPGRVTDGHRAALERLFLKMVESSGVPEIIWGPIASGNYASSADAMTTLVKYVQDKQAQKNEAYSTLWGATLRLYQQSRISNVSNDEIQIVWNDLDAISAQTKAQIFAQFASGISALIASSGATLEQIYMLWKSQFPKATESDFEEFKAGLTETAKHKQFAGSTYADSLALAGVDTQGAIDQATADTQAKQPNK